MVRVVLAATLVLRACRVFLAHLARTVGMACLVSVVRLVQWDSVVVLVHQGPVARPVLLEAVAQLAVLVFPAPRVSLVRMATMVRMASVVLVVLVAQRAPLALMDSSAHAATVAPVATLAKQGSRVPPVVRVRWVPRARLAHLEFLVARDPVVSMGPAVAMAPVAAPVVLALLVRRVRWVPAVSLDPLDPRARPALRVLARLARTV